MCLSSCKLFLIAGPVHTRKLEINEEQKKQLKKKNAALDVIRNLILDSPLISKDAKKERLTEVRNLPGVNDESNYHTSTLQS